MPNWKTVYGEPFDEEKWKKAKERAAEEGHAEDWPYVVGIYKRMARTGEYKPKFSRERERKDQTVDTWKEKHPKWQNRARNTTKSVDSDAVGVRLILPHGAELQEFRCGECGVLLFKGLNLEKSLIEVKCRSCGTMLVSPAMVVVNS